MIFLFFHFLFMAGSDDIPHCTMKPGKTRKNRFLRWSDFRVWDLGFGLGFVFEVWKNRLLRWSDFRVWDLGLRIEDLGFRISGMDFERTSIDFCVEREGEGEGEGETQRASR